MTAKHLLEFITTKAKRFPKDVIGKKDGKETTLVQVFETLNLKPEDLTVNTLDVYVSYITLQVLMP
jgi:AMP deaminase